MKKKNKATAPGKERITVYLLKEDKERVEAYARARRKTSAGVISDLLIPILNPTLVEKERATN
jgi:hypothetical protein